MAASSRYEARRSLRAVVARIRRYRRTASSRRNSPASPSAAGKLFLASSDRIAWYNITTLSAATWASVPGCTASSNPLVNTAATTLRSYM